MKRLLYIFAFLCSYVVASAQSPDAQEITVEKPVHFSWGADVGGCIDMTGNDMSSLAINVQVGIKCPGFEIVGAGAGTDVSVSNPCRSFPIYGILRTGFSFKPSLLFLDLRTGCSLNYLENNESQTGFYFSGGVGMHLATGKRFSSHIILAYSYFARDDIHYDDHVSLYPDLSYVNLRLGVNF